MNNIKCPECNILELTSTVSIISETGIEPAEPAHYAADGTWHQHQIERVGTFECSQGHTFDYVTQWPICSGCGEMICPEGE